MAEAKINPDYAQGDLVTLGTFPSQVEAEAIHSMLLGEGVPSVVSGEYIGRFSRTVLVPKSGYERAVELLNPGEDSRAHIERVRTARPSPLALLIGLAVAAGALALYVLLVSST